MIDELRKVLPNLIIEENADMSFYSTFKLGGFAKVLIKVSNINELKEVLRFVKENDVPFVILGNGSNTVFRDGIYNGFVIKFQHDSEFDEISVDGEYIKAGANVLLSNVAKIAQEHSLSGLERISGIPGSVGGATFMNAGAYEDSISNVLVSAIAVSSEDIKEFKLDEMNMGYRHSIFMDNGYVISSVVFKLKKGNKDEIFDTMKEYQLKRSEKQPLKYPSCGSVFKRPVGTFAGKLIEESGLKGTSVGGVSVSTLHAGFIINTNNGTATDLVNLIELIKRKVYEDHKVMLEEEIIII